MPPSAALPLEFLPWQSSMMVAREAAAKLKQRDAVLAAQHPPLLWRCDADGNPLPDGQVDLHATALLGWTAAMTPRPAMLNLLLQRNASTGAPGAFVLFTLPPSTAPPPAAAWDDRELLPAKHSVARFWRALPHARLDDDGRVLQLSDGAVFMSNNRLGSRLYVRDDYEKLFDLTMQFVDGGSRGMAILGAAGIGKTVFVLYILWRLRQADPQCAIVLDQLNTEVRCFQGQSVLRSSTCWGFRRELDQKSTWYVVDGKPPMNVRATTLLIPCPQGKDNYHSFYKRVNEVRHADMPVWSLEELLDARARCYPKISAADVTERFAHFGGCPRYVLSNLDLDDLLMLSMLL